MKRHLHRLLRTLGLHVERHRDVTADFAAAVPNAKCVIDGGAYHFKASRDFLRLFPAATVHAFEPNPALAEWATRIDDNRLRFHAQALSDAPGKATFHIPQHAFTASLLAPGSEFGATQAVEVDVVTLDQLGLKPDAIKLDLQGNELKALRGAEVALQTARAVLCEVNFVARYEGCCLFHEIAAHLHQRGFRFQRLYELHADKKGRWRFADALFVREQSAA